jgi:hypothetical protein
MCGAVYSFRCETVVAGQDENRYQYGLWYRKPSAYEYYMNTSSSPDKADWAQLSGGSGYALSSRTDCQAYDDVTEVDGLWKFLRALTIITLLLGGGWTIWMFCCNTILQHHGHSVSKSNWNFQVALLGTTLAVLHGLGFMFVDTNACEFSDAATCEWSTGLRANVASVVLWIVTAGLALWIGPTPAARVREATTVTVTYQRDPTTGQIIETTNGGSHNKENV